MNTDTIREICANLCICDRKISSVKLLGFTGYEMSFESKPEKEILRKLFVLLRIIVPLIGLRNNEVASVWFIQLSCVKVDHQPNFRVIRLRENIQHILRVKSMRLGRTAEDVVFSFREND